MLEVVSNGGVPLNKNVKLVAKVDHTRLLVVVEEVGDRGVEGAGSLIVIVHGEGEDGVVDRGVKPALDGVVALCPHRIGGTRRNCRVEEGKEPKLPDHGFEESAPAGEVRSVQFEGDRHVHLDIDRAEGIDDGRSDVIGDERARGRGVPVRDVEEEDALLEDMVVAVLRFCSGRGGG
jgi:hypothetical protein